MPFGGSVIPMEIKHFKFSIYLGPNKETGMELRICDSISFPITKSREALNERQVQFYFKLYHLMRNLIISLCLVLIRDGGLH